LPTHGGVGLVLQLGTLVQVGAIFVRWRRRPLPGWVAAFARGCRRTPILPRASRSRAGLQQVPAIGERRGCHAGLAGLVDGSGSPRGDAVRTVPRLGHGQEQTYINLRQKQLREVSQSD